MTLMMGADGSPSKDTLLQIFTLYSSQCMSDLPALQKSLWLEFPRLAALTDRWLVPSSVLS